MQLDKQKFKSQKEEVLFILQNRKSVPCVEFAVKYGILRYGASIFILRKEGRRIEMTDRYVKKGKRIQRQTCYSLK